MEEINKEKSELLDKILVQLKENDKTSYNTRKVATLMSLDYHEAYNLTDILLNHKLVESVDISGKREGRDKVVYINSKGIVFISKEGGFTTLFEKQEAARLKEEEFKTLQLKELKSRVENLEKTIKEQSSFWTSTTQKNKEQLWTIWLAIILSAAAVLIALFK